MFLRSFSRSFVRSFSWSFSRSFKLFSMSLLNNLSSIGLLGPLGPLYQTLEGYISKDIYISYPIQKSRKRIFPYPFFEWDMLKDIISLF
jgi:hypothetical protein